MWSSQKIEKGPSTKIQNNCMIKSLKQVETEEMYLNILNLLYKKVIVKENPEIFPWRSEKRHSCLLALCPLNIVLNILSKILIQDKNKNIQLAKEKVKIFLFLDDVILIFRYNSIGKILKQWLSTCESWPLCGWYIRYPAY